MQGGKWERVSLSGPEELQVVFPKVRMEGIAQRAQEQTNTGVLPPNGIHPEVFRKVVDYVFALNSNIKGVVSRSNNKEAPKVMALLGLLVRTTEIARQLPAAAKARTTADLGVDAPFTAVQTQATEAYDTTAACAYVKRDGSDEHRRSRERHQIPKEVESEGVPWGKRKFADMKTAEGEQILQTDLNQDEVSLGQQPSTHGSSPAKNSLNTMQANKTVTFSQGKQGAAAARATAGGEPNPTETIISGRLSYQLATTEAQFEHLKRVWVENQSLYGSGLYFTNVFSELQLDIEVEVQRWKKLTLRRSVWEGKANLRQEYRKKVNQAAKTAVCIYVHNLDQGVEVKRVHVPLGDDEEFILVQFEPERGTWHLGDHPGDLCGDIYVSEYVELTRTDTDPQNSLQSFKAGEKFLMGAAYILKAFLGEALSGLTPAEVDAILVKVEVERALSSVHHLKDAYRQDAKWFESSLNSYQRGPSQQVAEAALRAGVSTRGSLLREEAGVPSYTKVTVLAPERPPAMDPTTYQWKRLIDEADRLEQVAKELRREGQARQKQRLAEIKEQQQKLTADLAEIEKQS